MKKSNFKKGKLYQVMQDDTFYLRHEYFTGGRKKFCAAGDVLLFAGSKIDRRSDVRIYTFLDKDGDLIASQLGTGADEQHWIGELDKR